MVLPPEAPPTIYRSLSPRHHTHAVVPPTEAPPTLVQKLRSREVSRLQPLVRERSPTPVTLQQEKLTCSRSGHPSLHVVQVCVKCDGQLTPPILPKPHPSIPQVGAGDISDFLAGSHVQVSEVGTVLAQVQGGVVSQPVTLPQHQLL